MGCRNLSWLLPVIRGEVVGLWDWKSGRAGSFGEVCFWRRQLWPSGVRTEEQQPWPEEEQSVTLSKSGGRVMLMKEHEDKTFLRGKLFLGACLVFLSIWSWQVIKMAFQTRERGKIPLPIKIWQVGKANCRQIILIWVYFHLWWCWRI